jgi:hypothetical protein
LAAHLPTTGWAGRNASHVGHAGKAANVLIHAKSLINIDDKINAVLILLQQPAFFHFEVNVCDVIEYYSISPTAIIHQVVIVDLNLCVISFNTNIHFPPS